MMSRSKRLFKHTIIYAIGNFGSKALNLILLPFYTAVLTTEEYGTIDIVLVTLILLSPLVSVNMGESIYRFSMDKNYKKEEVFNSGLLICLCGLLLTMLGSFLLKDFLSYNEIITPFIILIFVFVFQGVVKQYARALEKLTIYMIGDIIQVVIFIALIFTFLNYYDMGVIGFVYAKIGALLAETLYVYISGKLYKTIGHRVNFEYSRQMLLFGLPLVPNSIMWWVSNASDRYILAAMASLSSVGIYSVAVKFPIIVAHISTVFFKSWQTSAIEQNESKDSSQYQTKVFNAYACFLFLLSSMIIVVIKPVMEILVSEVFYEAWRYVPILLLSAVYSSLGGFLGINYNVAKDTKRALISTVIAAVVNIVLNLILIPKYEVYGASIATLISFFILFVVRVIDTPRYKDMEFDFKLYSILSMLIILQMFLLYTIEAIYYQVGISSLLLIIMLVYIKQRLAKRVKQ
ncbi:lipopolysaccharide biosynthesis protein [Vibrio mediterranei]|uniref:lipopolysaccharide biosynthesis protein n=2 Tax=Vibrio TaxID=662 RepID=UPI0040675D6C